MPYSWRDEHIMLILPTLTGQENGRRFQRWWYSPSMAMPVQWYEEISASRMGATYSMAATFAIRSVP